MTSMFQVLSLLIICYVKGPVCSLSLASSGGIRVVNDHRTSTRSPRNNLVLRLLGGDSPEVDECSDSGCSNSDSSSLPQTPIPPTPSTDSKCENDADEISLNQTQILLEARREALAFQEEMSMVSALDQLVAEFPGLAGYDAEQGGAPTGAGGPVQTDEPAVGKDPPAGSSPGSGQRITLDKERVASIPGSLPTRLLPAEIRSDLEAIISRRRAAAAAAAAEHSTAAESVAAADAAHAKSAAATPAEGPEPPGKGFACNGEGDSDSGYKDEDASLPMPRPPQPPPATFHNIGALYRDSLASPVARRHSEQQ